MTEQLSCECGCAISDHKILTFVTGRMIQRCKGLGIEKRPIEPGSNVMCTHYNCPCKKDITPKVYIVKKMDTRTNEEFSAEEYPTKEQAQGRINQLNEACEEMWCDHHKHWIEEHQEMTEQLIECEQCGEINTSPMAPVCYECGCRVCVGCWQEGGHTMS